RKTFLMLNPIFSDFLSPYKRRREVVPMMNIPSMINLISQVVGMVCRVISAICSILTYLKNKKK
ncbi:MAG TPA: hypothetical protein DDW30_06290, partial [Clostridiales bacterium]|nr:hypothetical protein [Clostridiales bacterium]